MSTETQEILEYAAQKFGSQQVETAMVESPVIEPAAESSQAAMASVIEEAPIQTTETTQEAPVETQPVVEQIAPDYNKWLEEQTGGLIKDVDTFKQSLPKISEYEAIAQQKQELEKNKISYANSFVKELNELALSGAGKDQLKAFVKLSEVGELSELNAIEAKVAKLVLVDGFSEAVARKKIERDFPLSDLEEGSDERQIAEEELRVSSKSDLEALKKYKTELSTVENPALAQAEQERLQHIAQTEQHERLVKQEAPKIASFIQGLGKINLTGKEGDDAVFLDFPFPEDFKGKVSTMAEDYFLENNEPITQESVDNFAEYARAKYLAENITNVAKSIWTHAESILSEKYSNKYENRSGLKTEEEPVPKVSTEQDRMAFLERVANGK